MTTAGKPNDELSARSSDLGYLVAVRVAVVSGAFCALVSTLLVADYAGRRAKDPSEDAQLAALRDELARQPESGALQKRLRDLDLQLRQQYFRRRRFAEMGGWLLLGGTIVFLVAAKSAATLRRKLPMPGPQPGPQDTETPMTRLARWSVAGLAAVLVGTAAVLSLSYDTELASPPEPETRRKSWDRFRGPGGLGISMYDNIPTFWDASSGEGILWKTAVPLPGHNSPVVCGDRVFLSGATEQKRQVYCFDANSGGLLWKKDVPSTLTETLTADQISEDTGFAAPTTTTDGNRVYAIFANGDLAAFDFSGELVWSKSLGIPDNSYGHASSLVVHGSLLLIQLDQGGLAKEKKSKLLALDVATGETVYAVPRPVPNSWMTPCLASVGGRVQLVTGGDPWVIAYDPANGSEIWRADCLSGDCGPSPVVVDGVAYVGNEYCQWSAIKADGRGDVTETHVLWTAEDGLPDTCSPLVADGFLFLMSYDLLTCYDVQTGELLWDTYDNEEADFGTNFTSSPSWAGGLIYLFGEDGKGWLIKPTREKAEVVAQTDLGEPCVTSPAFQDGRIYIRGKQHLFCIGK